MKKIPTIFERDWNGDRSRVTEQVNPAAQWVFDGEGIATVKLDGTCCMVRDGRLYKRREIKKGDAIPIDMDVVDADSETGKLVGWVPVGDGPEDRYHREAWASLSNPLSDGTYELVGPKVQGNPEGYPDHRLVTHGCFILDDAPRAFAALKEWLAPQDIEGIVWHHPDGRMAKIKKRDFGLKRR